MLLLWLLFGVYQAAGDWTLLPNLLESRWRHKSFLVNGSVVIVGGWPANISIFDQNTWRNVSMNERGESASSAVLPDGRILVVGGSNAGSGVLASSELFDLGTNTWQESGSMVQRRIYHEAVMLVGTSKVMIVGGFEDATCNIAAKCELWDLGSFSSCGDIAFGPMDHARAVSLPNGDVLVTGDKFGSRAAYLYTYQTNTWAATGTPMMIGRQRHATVVLLDGSVLIVGGYWYDTAPSELYRSNQFVLSGALQDTRCDATLLLVPSTGFVIAAGGIAPGPNAQSISSVELYHPVQGTWTELASMSIAHCYHSAILFNGQMLITGGFITDVVESYYSFGVTVPSNNMPTSIPLPPAPSPFPPPSSPHPPTSQTLGVLSPTDSAGDPSSQSALPGSALAGIIIGIFIIAFLCVCVVCQQKQRSSFNVRDKSFNQDVGSSVPLPLVTPSQTALAASRAAIILPPPPPFVDTTHTFANNNNNNNNAELLRMQQQILDLQLQIQRHQQEANDMQQVVVVDQQPSACGLALEDQYGFSDPPPAYY